MAEKVILPDLAPSDEMFLHELSDTIGRLHDRHLGNPKEFFPFDFLQAPEGAPDELEIPDAVLVSLLVNLITEEGLPYYTSVLDRGTPKGHPFREWLNQWTAEEGRHAPTIANFMYSTGQFDMHELERARMAMMTKPDTPQPGSFIEGIVYPAFQEPATETSHRNTLSMLPRAHRLGKKALGFVAGDERKHGAFYLDVATAALEVEPSLTVIAIAKQVKGFAMPGKSIPGFNEHKVTIEEAGIFGREHLKAIYDRIITDTWKIWDLEGLSDEASRARDDLARRMAVLEKSVKNYAERHATS